MGAPYIGEIKIVSFNFAPKGWALCNGQLMPINQNQALFAVLGTTYGGDGRQTFGLPNLQARVPFHFGGNGLVLGQRGGELAHTLNLQELAQHTHTATGSSGAADQGTPVGNFWAKPASNAYSTTPNNTMATQAVLPVGGNQAHDNMSPYLVLNFVIALIGQFPQPT
jgi:microcystin-dependent protein